MNKQFRDLTESQGILILSKYSKNLICRICCNLFQKPMRLHPCGHTFCQQCVQHDFIRICPRCEQTIEIIQNDLLGRKLVSDIKVKCTKEGCPWRGNYQQFYSVHKDRCLLDLEQNSWMGKIHNIVKKYDQYIVKKYEEKNVKKLNPEKQQQIKIQQILSQKEDNENLQVQIKQHHYKIKNLQILSHQDNQKVQNIQKNNHKQRCVFL